MTAIKLNPSNANYYANLGECMADCVLNMIMMCYCTCVGVVYHLKKDFASAQKYYSIALEMDPGLHETRTNLKKLQKHEQ